VRGKLIKGHIPNGLKKYLQKFSLVFLSDDSQAVNIKPNKGVDKDNRHDMVTVHGTDLGHEL
jgi:hypothetical protein